SSAGSRHGRGSRALHPHGASPGDGRAPAGLARAMTPLPPLRHGRVTLALHALRAAEGGCALLCLHGLHGSSEDLAELAGGWPGPVCALDFAGHGRSAWCRGGVYSPELLAGDADVALARIGTACVAGIGLGAYVALLLA